MGQLEKSKLRIMTKGSRPEQAVLTKDTDMSKTAETRAVIEGMVDGLNDHRIGDIGEFFADGFRWMGNTGCGTKNNLKEFQDNWQKPFQAAFSDKVCIDEARRYMDFWKVVDGKIVDNYVSVDFPHVMAQLGKDAFDGNGWEVYDRGERDPPAPKTAE